MKRIAFYFDDVADNLKDKKVLSNFINEIITEAGKRVGPLAYTFTTDLKLLELNKQFLKHKTFTDIITFDYNDKDLLSGEIFISTERVAENSQKYNQALETELLRVIFHGLLHLLGEKDKTSVDAERMRGLENTLIDRYTAFKKNVSRETHKT
jgi:probable rRNA maturation factor